VRTYVDPAISAVHGNIDRLNEMIRQTNKAEAEADLMPQGAAKAGQHQRIQRDLGEKICRIAADLNNIGARLRAQA